jgi:excinuclease ABC subunit A
VDEVIGFLSGFTESQPAKRAITGLALLQEIGLGYLKLGQPINTLSGGESQRLKLVRHLAEVADAPTGQHASRSANPRSDRFEVPAARQSAPARRRQSSKFKVQSSSLTPPGAPPGTASKPLLFLFDEPTTGLHFDDVRVLLKVFQRLVDAGHSVVVIEHNLEVIKSADWIIDLGPDAGDQGGEIVAHGTPDHIADCPASRTGQALRKVLEPSCP